jgi:hypothetical protein
MTGVAFLYSLRAEVMDEIVSGFGIRAYFCAEIIQRHQGKFGGVLSRQRFYILLQLPMQVS